MDKMEVISIINSIADDNMEYHKKRVSLFKLADMAYYLYNQIGMGDLETRRALRKLTSAAVRSME